MAGPASRRSPASRRCRPAASGSGCSARRRRAERGFDEEDVEIARAVAHLAAVAIKRAELIEGLTNASIVKDLFEALAAGATTFAAAKAAEVRCELTAPYLLVWAQPAGAREQSSGDWRADAEALGRGLAELAPPLGDRSRPRPGAGAARPRDDPGSRGGGDPPRVPRTRRSATRR